MIDRKGDSMSKIERFKYATVKSLPVLAGYLFLGMSLGILVQQAGVGVLGVLLMSTFVFAGSFQFLMAGFLLVQTPLPTVAIMGALISSRHLFYGLSFLNDFQTLGWRKWYVAFALTDESYSLLLSLKEENLAAADRDAISFWICLLDHLYWIVGTIIGVLLGDALPFDFRGIEFSMTSLFVVLLLHQISGTKKEAHLAALIGGASSGALLLLLGQQHFLLPSILVSSALLFWMNERQKEAA